MIVAISGTPGTGKSSVSAVLAAEGYHVLDLDLEAERLGLLERDAAGDTVVDVQELARQLRVPTKVAFVRGHYAHRVPVNTIIVLRCHPRELRRRLELRGWRAEKIRENVEAEAIDVILQEALGAGVPVFEVDTSSMRPEQAAAAILAVLHGNTTGYEPGGIDWSEEVLTWS